MKGNFKFRRFGIRTNLCIGFGIILSITICSFGEPGAAPLKAIANRSPLPTVAEAGTASYYGTKYHGKSTASGELFNMNALTAAHPKLAFGTRVKVTHLENNRSVTVRINDRGPFVPGRVIDLSQAAAMELQMIQSGLAPVRIEIIK